VTDVGNVKDPDASTVTLSVPFVTTKPVPVRPVTVPPTEKATGTHTTVMFVMFAAPTVPVPFVTVQVAAGFVGPLWTVTA
jgi:hypothetical protein